jgi:acyl carrier protein
MTRAAFRSVLEEILSVDAGSLRDTDSRETVEGWSSLVDVQILAFISSELGLEEEAEMLSFESIGELLDTLEQRGALTAA